MRHDAGPFRLCSTRAAVEKALAHRASKKENHHYAASIIGGTDVLTIRSRAGVADWMAYQSHPGPLFAHGLYHLRAVIRSARPKRKKSPDAF
jgi:hypothetical protein